MIIGVKSYNGGCVQVDNHPFNLTDAIVYARCLSDKHGMPSWVGEITPIQNNPYGVFRNLLDIRPNEERITCPACRGEIEITHSLVKEK